MRHTPLAMAQVLAWAVVLVGCRAGTDDTHDSGEPVVDDAVRDEAGNLLLVHWQDAADFDGSTVLAGLFVDDLQGVYNPIECLFQFNYCFARFPEQPGDVVEVDPTVRFRLDDADYRFNGDVVTLGDARAEYIDDVAAGAEYYYGALGPEVYQPGTSVGVSLDGEWGVWDGEAELTLPSAMRVLEPDPLSPLLLVEGQDTVLRWEPGEGRVLLLLASSAGASIRQLEDDGEHVLSWEAVGAQPGEELIVVLGRWAVADLDVNGNDLRVQAGDEQWFSARVSHIDLAQLDPVELADACSGTDEPLAPGTYWGTFDGFGADLDPGEDGCTGWEAQGAEGMVPVRLEPGEIATVRYELLTGDGSVYVLTDCTDSSSCVAGTDRATGGAETVRWINDQGVAQDYWVVLDVYDAARGGTFVVDLAIEASTPPPLVDSCEQVAGATPLGAGAWSGSLLGAGNELDLDDPPCVPGTGEDGVDRFARIELGPSERVEITMRAATDAGVVLLSDCSNADSCVAGDASTVGAARADHVNLGDEVEVLTLAIDGQAELYDLDVFFESIDLAEQAPNCGAAVALPVLGEGTWYGDTSADGNDLQLAASGCTGHTSPGPDGLVRVEVPAGQRLRASLDMPGANPALYLLPDCADPGSCVAGADHDPGGFETVVYDNLTGVTETHFLVLDSEHDGGPYALDLSLMPVQWFEPADGCGGLGNLDALQTGIYLGDLTGFADDVTPTDCTGFLANGGEGMARLVLPAGAAADLALSMHGGDASLYVLEDCTDPGSCVVGADYGFNPDGHFEIVRVDNPGTAERELVVVLDAYQQTGPFELHVRIE